MTVAADWSGEATRNPQEARPGCVEAGPGMRRLTTVREASGVWTSRVTAERFRAADIEEAVRAGALQPLLPALAVLWGKERRIAESCARATRAEMIAAGVDMWGIVEIEHNLEVYQGLNNMLRLLIGAAVSTGGANYANGNARLCVGDGAGSVPTAAVTDTDLAALTGASHRYMNACDSTFPSVPSGGNNLASSKLTATATVATGNGNFCYHPSTEILTGRGWVPIAEIEIDEPVATVSPRGALVFQNTSDVQQFDFDGELLQFKGRSLDALVTPNHKMVARRPRTQGRYNLDPSWSFGHWTLIQADNIRTSDWSAMKAASPVERSDIAEIRIPGVEVRHSRGGTSHWTDDLVLEMDGFLALLGLYLAEGTAYGAHIAISQSQERNPMTCRFIEKVLSGFGPMVLENRDEFGRKAVGQRKGRKTGSGLSWSHNEHSYFVFDVRLARYLAQFGKSAWTKSVPSFIKTLSARQIDIFLSAYIEGDGTRRPGSPDAITTTSPQMRDDLQELAVLAGHACDWNAVAPHINSFGKRTKYILSVKHRSLTCSLPKPVPVPYVGPVHCCTVPEWHTLITRRNGKTLVCGNSWNEVGLDSGGASGTGAASGLFNHIGSNILTKTSAAAVALTLVVTQS